MITRLVLDKVTIETRGIGTGPISGYVKDRLDNAFANYNKACDKLKGEHATAPVKYPSVESEWFKWCDWAGTYKVVTDFLVSHEEGRKTFPNMSGYIERIEE